MSQTGSLVGLQEVGKSVQAEELGCQSEAIRVCSLEDGELIVLKPAHQADWPSTESRGGGALCSDKAD